MFSDDEEASISATCRALTPESERAFEALLKPFVMRLAFRSFEGTPRASRINGKSDASEIVSVAPLSFYALVYARYRDLRLRLEEVGKVGDELRRRWRAVDERWFSENASRVADHLEWVASKTRNASEASPCRHDDDETAALVLQYEQGRFPLNLSNGGEESDPHTTAMRLLVTLALLEDAIRAPAGRHVPSPTLGHVGRTLGLSEETLGLLRGVKTPGEALPCAWWWVINDEVGVERGEGDKHVERSGARWMHLMNRFLNVEYVSLMDDACRCFGVAVTVGLTEDRASWWKPRKADAIACANFVAGMSTAERARCKDRLGAASEAGIAYHVPVCVAMNGYYSSDHARENDLLRLFERITGHLRKGDRMFVWLCERVTEMLAELRARAYVGEELVVSNPSDTKELHDNVVAQITGVKVVRLCTLASADAKLAQSHTRSDIFAGVVQMVCAMRAKWRWGDPRVEKAYTDLRAYVFRLREAQRLICDDLRNENVPTPTESKIGLSSRHNLLDTFLEVLVESDASQWTASVARMPGGERTHDPREGRNDFLSIMMRCARHPFERPDTPVQRDDALARHQGPKMHGLFMEGTPHAPVFALPPTSRATCDTAETRIGGARLCFWNPAPMRAPITADRLCRRLYRPLPIRHETEDATNTFLRNHVYRSCPVSRRRSQLVSLCESDDGVAHEEAMIRRLTSEEFARELVVMREERLLLDPQENADNLVTCTFEFAFWLREFLATDRRWVKQACIVKSDLPAGMLHQRPGLFWAHVFAIYPDEMRLAFRSECKSLSNCVVVAAADDVASIAFVRYRLKRLDDRDERALLENLRARLRLPWYSNVDASGRVVLRVASSERYATELIVRTDRTESREEELKVTDVREASFVAGAEISTKSMGTFVRYMFWGLVQAMSDELDRPWSDLVPKGAARRLPTVRGCADLPLSGSDGETVSVVDACWREFIMWVVVELQRIMLLMRSSAMGSRISGVGLHLMAAKKPYGGGTVASVLEELQECRKARTKRVVRPNSYLNSRCVSLLASIGCTYFPFDFDSMLSRCARHIGFVRAPGYDARKHPYLNRVFVDDRGDVRDDVPMCFANRSIGPKPLSAVARNRCLKAGYTRVATFGKKLGEELCRMRAMNAYGARVEVCDVDGQFVRRDRKRTFSRGSVELEDLSLERLATSATGIAAHSGSLDPLVHEDFTDDRHSAESVGVAYSHARVEEAAQWGTRFVFCDPASDKSPLLRYRVCLGDGLRRARLGFAEETMGFWDDLSGSRAAEEGTPSEASIEESVQNTSDAVFIARARVALELRREGRDVFSYARFARARRFDTADFKRRVDAWLQERCGELAKELRRRLSIMRRASSAAENESFSRLMDFIDSGLEEDLPPSPRVAFRWVCLCGNACAVLACARSIEQLGGPDSRDRHVEETATIVDATLRDFEELLASMFRDVSLSEGWPSIDGPGRVSTPSVGNPLSFVLDLWVTCVRGCMARAAAFYVDEDRAYGVDRASFGDHESANRVDEFSHEEVRIVSRQRCNRSQLLSIMSESSSEELNDLSRPAFFAHDDLRARFLWVDVLNECLTVPEESSDSLVAEDSKCVSPKSSEGESESRSDEESGDAAFSVVGMNDICYSNVCRSLRTEQTVGRRTSKALGLIVEMSIRTSGCVRNVWTEASRIDDNHLGGALGGCLRMLHVEISGEVQKAFERELLSLQKQRQEVGNIFLEMAVRDVRGNMYSTRARPFRFLMDELIGRHVVSTMACGTVPFVWLPRTTRCDLVTNERRIVRQKDGASGALISEGGIATAFRCVMSSLLFVTDTDLTNEW
eukprot:gene25-35_t